MSGIPLYSPACPKTRWNAYCARRHPIRIFTGMKYSIQLAIILLLVVSGCISSRKITYVSRPTAYYCPLPRAIAVERVTALMTELGYTITLVSVEAGILQARHDFAPSDFYTAASRAWKFTFGDSIRVYPTRSIVGSKFTANVQDAPVRLDLIDSSGTTWELDVVDRLSRLCSTEKGTGR